MSVYNRSAKALLMTNLPPDQSNSNQENPTAKTPDAESAAAQPSHSPTDQAPTDRAPTDPAPIYAPPVYQPPVYQPPVYQAPTGQPPTYQPPVYQPPAYEPPAYQPPTPPAPPTAEPLAAPPAPTLPQAPAVNQDPAGAPGTPPQYQAPVAPQQPYEQPQYAAPQQPYAQPQYAQPHYAQPQYTQPQYGDPQQYYYPAPAAQPAPFPLPPAGPGEPFDGAYSAEELNRPLYGASFGNAFTRFFKNYANFRGRASRSEYWWMVLIFTMAFVAMGVLIGFVEAASSYSSPGGEAVSAFFGLMVFVVFIGSFIPWLSLTWRRLHDVNLPGPLYFITLVPYVGGLVLLILHLLSPKPEGRRFDRPER